MAKLTRRKSGFTVAVLPTGTKVSAKRRRKSLAPELRLEEGRKLPHRADGTPRAMRSVARSRHRG